MARPPLTIGTHGRIKTVRVSEDGVKPENWRARCRFRDLDGGTRPVERYGPSRTKAEASLQKALQQRAGKPVQQITDTARIRELVEIYLANIETKVKNGTRAATTYDRYVSAANTHINPKLGALTVQECDTSRLQDVLDDMEEQGFAGSTRSIVRSVMRGVMQVAVRRNLLTSNPGTSLDRIDGVTPKQKPRALSLEEFRDFITKLDTDKTAQRTDILDTVRTLFATGLRVSEALALRWRDLNLTECPVRMMGEDGTEQAVDPHSMWINGGVVYVAGVGAVRNGGKTFHSRRVVGMPDFLHTLLIVRRDEYAKDDDPVFPAPQGGWRDPRTVHRNLTAACTRIGYPDVKSHWGRKTVAFVLDDAGQNARKIADVLGQASIATTQRHYIARGMANPGAVAAIDAWHKQTGQ